MYRESTGGRFTHQLLTHHHQPTMSNEEDNVRIKELEKQLAVINTAINMQSNDPDRWATIKDSPDFEIIGQMALMDLYRLNMKLKDELYQLEKQSSAEKLRRLESMVFNAPSIDPVTANVTVTKKGEPFAIDHALI